MEKEEKRRGICDWRKEVEQSASTTTCQRRGIRFIHLFILTVENRAELQEEIAWIPVKLSGATTADENDDNHNLLLNDFIVILILRLGDKASAKGTVSGHWRVSERTNERSN